MKAGVIPLGESGLILGCTKHQRGGAKPGTAGGGTRQDERFSPPTGSEPHSAFIEKRGELSLNGRREELHSNL